MDFDLDDLDAYLTRIGHSGPVDPTFKTLQAVQRAHIHAIPFENLDPLRGVVPSLEIGDLMAKLVHGTGRGGYCYEQNTLYATALRTIGFRVTLLAARVLSGARPGDLRPRTHMLMLTEAPGDPQPYLTDVGFGSAGAPLDPVPLIADAEFEDTPRRHRLVHEPHDGPLELWVLQSFGEGEWRREYSFTVEPYYAPDFEVVNFHVARNPRSPFSGRLFAQRTFPDRHLSLDTRKLTEVSVADGAKSVRELADDAEVVAVLARDFGIVAPPGVLD